MMLLDPLDKYRNPKLGDLIWNIAQCLLQNRPFASNHGCVLVKPRYLSSRPVVLAQDYDNNFFPCCAFPPLFEEAFQ